MSWTILIALTLALALAVAVTAARRGELRRMSRRVDSLAQARERGTRNARLQYPNVDLGRCLGCGTCIQACPEEGVLELIHGQAVVVHGARCVGHGRCAEECPTGAIAVTLGDIEGRDDIPVLSEQLEAPEQPGLFLAGEVTGYALIRTAIQHGTSVAAEVARRTAEAPGDDDAWDLCIVGAGPAGIACALEAKARGLRFVVIEQESLGGTVAKYPRRKLVMSQPVDLPLHGRLKQQTWVKEELMELWSRIATEHDLPIHTNVRFEGVSRDEAGAFAVRTGTGDVHARHVCLALGRRGTPRKLDVPGEELPKVAYSLIDAQSYQDRKIIVVGGGDSAIEAALGLAEQPGNEVTLSYRKHAFFRLKARNEARIEQAVREGRVRVLFESQILGIRRDDVRLAVGRDGQAQELDLPNDEVFVLAGGIPPFRVLGDSGVSFDHAARAAATPAAKNGSGLLLALSTALFCCLASIPWFALHHHYYALARAERPFAGAHSLLKPSGTLGLAFGIAATACILANLAYLVRRNRRIPLRVGSLQVWMTAHVATGILALLLTLLHSAMAPQQTVGGHALAGLAVLVVTGAIGRYFYAFVPRATNGREMALDEVKAELAALSSEWDRENRGFANRVRDRIHDIANRGRWDGSFGRRVWTLLRTQRELHRSVRRMKDEGRREGIPGDQLDRIVALALRAQRTALMAAHYEDLRALLSSWRYLHRWVALLMVLLVAAHVFAAVRYGGVLG